MFYNITFIQKTLVVSEFFYYFAPRLEITFINN
jgi:hypothetical protein